MIDPGWVSILGPGGLIALVVVVDRLIRNWRAARHSEMQATNDQWQEIVKERDAMARAQRRQLSAAWDAVDYWRLRAGHAEYLLRANNITIPSSPPEPPKRLGQ